MKTERTITRALVALMDASKWPNVTPDDDSAIEEHILDQRLHAKILALKWVLSDSTDLLP